MHMDNLKIYGFRANIDSVGDVLSKINEIKGDSEIIQLLNADAIASRNHVIHGVNQAINAFERGENIANDLGVEVLLRCSAQRQISKAFKILGLSEGEMNLCAVLIDCGDYIDELESLFVRDDDVLHHPGAAPAGRAGHGGRRVPVRRGQHRIGHPRSGRHRRLPLPRRPVRPEPVRSQLGNGHPARHPGPRGARHPDHPAGRDLLCAPVLAEEEIITIFAEVSVLPVASCN